MIVLPIGGGFEIYYTYISNKLQGAICIFPCITTSREIYIKLQVKGAIITSMSKITKGHIITQNLDGTDHLDCLYRISLKALIYNDVGQILVVKEIDRTYWDLPGGGMDFGETIESSLKRELYEEVGYKGGLHYQLFDASDEMYIERIDANQICFYCRVWLDNFDFIPGEEGDEIMFINPEELLLQKSEVDAPARAYRAHMKWQKLYSKQ